MKKLFTIICLLCLTTICFTACKHEHTIVTDTAVAPTCSAEGKTEGSHCSVCNEVITAQEVVAKAEHTAVTDEAITPTCTAEGMTEGSHCSVCGEVITAQETVAKLEHTTVTDEAIAPTCIADGKTEGSHCSVCGEIITAQEVVAKLEHTVVTDRAVASTCAKTGLTEGTHCSVCGTVLTAQQTVAKLAHTSVADKAVTATCTSTGLTEGSHCPVCGMIIVAQKTVNKTAHNYQNDICTVCGAEPQIEEEVEVPVTDTEKPALNLPTDCYEMNILFENIDYVHEMKHVTTEHSKYDIHAMMTAYRYAKDTQIFGVDGVAIFDTDHLLRDVANATLVMHSTTNDSDYTQPRVWRDWSVVNKIYEKMYNEVITGFDKLMESLGNYTVKEYITYEYQWIDNSYTPIETRQPLNNAVESFRNKTKEEYVFIKNEDGLPVAYESPAILVVESNGLTITIVSQLRAFDNAKYGIIYATTTPLDNITR